MIFIDKAIWMSKVQYLAQQCNNECWTTHKLTSVWKHHHKFHCNTNVYMKYIRTSHILSLKHLHATCDGSEKLIHVVEIQLKFKTVWSWVKVFSDICLIPFSNWVPLQKWKKKKITAAISNLTVPDSRQHWTRWRQWEMLQVWIENDEKHVAPATWMLVLPWFGSEPVQTRTELQN